jgi:hypothetical protein
MEEEVVGQPHPWPTGHVWRLLILDFVGECGGTWETSSI